MCIHVLHHWENEKRLCPWFWIVTSGAMWICRSWILIALTLGFWGYFWIVFTFHARIFIRKLFIIILSIIFWLAFKWIFAILFLTFLRVYFLDIQPQWLILFKFILFFLLRSWKSSSAVMFFYQLHRLCLKKVSKPFNYFKLRRT